MSLGLKFKVEYNKQLSRVYKAEKYLNTCNEKEFEKWLPEFDRITIFLSKKILEAEKLGYHMTDNEILEGFKK